MKKVSFIILTILLCFVIQASAISIPAPFERAKVMALRVPMDDTGRHLIYMTISRDGEEIIYIVGYFPYYGIIGIGKSNGNDIIVFEYHERTGEHTVWRNGLRGPIDSKVSIREAFAIFREMVTEVLI